MTTQQSEAETSETSAPPPGEGAVGQPKNNKLPRPKAEKVLPTERMGYATQIELLRAWGQLGAKGTTSIAEVAKVVNIHQSTAGLANAFFVDVGLLARTSDGLAPAPEVVAYANAYQWNADTAAHKLAPLFEAAWFGVAALPKLRFKPHTRSQAINVLGEAAGASPAHKSQLETLLELLVAAGLVTLDGDTVRATKREEAPSPPPPPMQSAGSAQATPRTDAQPAGAFNFSVSLTMADIARLPAEQIAPFLTGLADLMKVAADLEKKRGG